MQVQLIDDLLDVSRIVTGKLKIELKPVDLCAVDQGGAGGRERAAEAKALTFTSCSMRPSGPSRAIRPAFSRSWPTCSTNAIKFSSENGKVTVVLDRRRRTRPPPGRATRGSGSSPSSCPTSSVDSPRKTARRVRKHGGLGLGLAIVRHLVEAHGGTVRGESEGKGKGSTFSVFLPLMDAASDAPEDASTASGSRSVEACAQEASSTRRVARLRVLVVDDDPGSREAVAEMLSGWERRFERPDPRARPCRPRGVPVRKFSCATSRCPARTGTR